MAKNAKIASRIEDIQADNEAECRWGRKQLLDFYCDVHERGAGTPTPEDKLCQACEETIVTHCNGKGEPVRTVHKRRLIMPAKMEAADGVRKMLGWDKKTIEDVPDDVTELMVMIRRKSAGANALDDKPDSIHRSRSCLPSTCRLELVSQVAQP